MDAIVAVVGVGGTGVTTPGSGLGLHVAVFEALPSLEYLALMWGICF